MLRRLRDLLIVLALLGGVGFVAYSVSLKAGIRERQAVAAQRLEGFAAALFSPMDDDLPEITAEHPLVRSALERPDDVERIRRLNRYLEILNQTARTEAIYVLDERGLTIAASNWRDQVTSRQQLLLPSLLSGCDRAGARPLFGVGTVSQLPGCYASRTASMRRSAGGVVVVQGRSRRSRCALG